MQSFRVREFVRVGTPDEVVEWRDMWLQRGVDLLTSLGLPAKSDVASDPFFGRGGKILAAGQKEQKLKFEVLVPVISAEDPTAVCSFNFHQEHFGSTFDIRTQDGNVANTACLGFGLERIVMALFKTHGFDTGEVAEGNAPAAVAVESRCLERVTGHRSAGTRPRQVSAQPAARGKLRVGREELLRRHLDRGHSRARPRAARHPAVRRRDRLRGRPMDVLQASPRRAARSVRHRRAGAECLAARCSSTPSSTWPPES